MEPLAEQFLQFLERDIRDWEAFTLDKSSVRSRTLARYRSAVWVTRHS